MKAPIISDLRPHHFSISVPNIEDGIHFWTEIFGATVDHRFRVDAIGGDGAFLSIAP